MIKTFRFWYIIYSLLAIGISIQLMYLIVPPNDNNYKIFAASFFHLLSGQDLYQLYPNEHFDLYKYTPTFALFFGFLAVLPETVGLIGWNLINVLVLLFGIAQLPYLKAERKQWLVILIIPELVLTVQNAQSNALIAGLLLCSFAMAERKKVIYAVLLGPVVTAFIKLFGAAFGLMGILYAFRFEYIIWGVIITILLVLLPLPITGVEGLVFQYKSYLALLGADHAASLGLSVMGWLTSWFNLSISKIDVLCVGLTLLLLPLIKLKNYDQANFRLLFMTYIMIWMVIFNHRAESPTYIIAVVAALIAILATKTIQWFHYLVIAILMVFTSLVMSELFPNRWKDAFFIPYVIKAVPCIGIWIWNGYMLLCYRKEH